MKLGRLTIPAYMASVSTRESKKSAALNLPARRSLVWRARNARQVASAVGISALLWACSSQEQGTSGAGGVTGTGATGDVGGTVGNTGGAGNATGGAGVGTGGATSTGGVTASGGSEPVLDPSQPLSERVDVFDVELSGAINNGTNLFSTVYPAVRPGGGLTLGWNEGDLGHLTRLDADMAAEGVEWDFPGLMIVGALGLPDDGVALLVIDHTSALSSGTTIDRELRLRILDANGNQTRETSIVGGGGIGVDATWFAWALTRSVAMVANGDRFSLYLEIARTFPAALGTHQGDLYLEVDADGNVDEATRDVWSASHSNRQHLVLGPDGEGLRLTVGDSNPFGLEYQTDAPSGDVVVWPPEDQRAAGKEARTSIIAAGDLCGFQYRDGRLYATASSGKTQPFSPNEDFGDVLLLSWDKDIEDGGDVSVTWLTDTPATAEICPTLTALGDDHQLSVWGDRDGTTATLALLDAQGKLVSGPTLSTAPFHTASLAVQLPGGDVAWTYAGRSASTVQVAIVRAD